MRRTVAEFVGAPAALAIIGLLSGGPVQAKDADEWFLQVTPFAGYRFGGSFEDKDTGQTFDLEDEPAVGVSINFPATPETEWEIYYSRQSTEIFVGGPTTESPSLDISYYHLGGTYLFDEQGASQPYFVATLGVAHYDPKSSQYRSDNFFSFAAGGGWKFFPNRRLGLRLDGRFIGTFIDSNAKIFCQSSGGATCVVNVKGDILWQFEASAGVIVRF